MLGLAEPILITGGRAVADNRGCLLRGTLHGHEPHRRPERGFTDRFRVGSVILLQFDEGLHVRRRDQFDLVPQLRNLPTPMMAAGASLHRDRARLDRCQELQYLAARDLPAKSHRPVSPNCMDLDRSLRQIQADYANLFHGRLPPS